MTSVESVVRYDSSRRIPGPLPSKNQPLSVSLSPLAPSARQQARDAGIARTPNAAKTFRYPSSPTAAGATSAPKLKKKCNPCRYMVDRSRWRRNTGEVIAGTGKTVTTMSYTVRETEYSHRDEATHCCDQMYARYWPRRFYSGISKHTLAKKARLHCR